MKYLHCFVLGIVVLFSATLSAVDTTTFWASDDAFADEGEPGTNFNTERLQIQGFSGTSLFGVESVQQSFLKFGVPGLEEKTILKVRFRVYLNEAEWSNVPIPPTLQLSWLENDSWDESTLDWDNRPIDLQVKPIGESKSIGDFGYQEWLLYQKDTIFDFWENDHLEADPRASYMLTVGNPDLTSFAYFSSKEGANQPELIIDYIPEPATLALLGLGAALLRMRKNR